MIGSDLQSVTAEFRYNQVLRIVIVPASYAKTVNKNSYSDVTALNLKDSQIRED
jgi:hypothetical protein